MAPVLTCNVRAAGPILLALRAAGIDLDVVATRLNMTPELLLDSDARLPVAQLLLPLWDLAEELLGDRLVGLHAAQNISRESFDIFSYIAAASATLGEAAERVIRYFRLITDSGTYALDREGGEAWWRFRPADAATAACQQDSIFALAVVVAHIRLWLDPEFVPHEVQFHHATLPDCQQLETFFGTPIRLGATQCAFRFEASTLDRPLCTADPQLAKFLERYAESALAALPALGQVSRRVRELLTRGLPGRKTSLKLVAQMLAMSERSLQRELRAENTNLKQLAEELRRELAAQYLKQPELSVAEVAYLLGFSETAPFFRAFKKWTGLTPGDFRRGARGKAPIQTLRTT